MRVSASPDSFRPVTTVPSLHAHQKLAARERARASAVQTDNVQLRTTGRFRWMTLESKFLRSRAIKELLMATVTYPEGAGLALSIHTTGATQSPSVKRISWSAIFAGVTVAVAVQLAAEPARRRDRLRPGRPAGGRHARGRQLRPRCRAVVAGQQPAGAGAGGYTAAWLAGNTLRFDGMLHGIVTWGVTLLLTFYLLTTAIGGLIGGAFSMVGGVASSAASAAGEGLRGSGTSGRGDDQRHARSRCSSRPRPTCSRPTPTQPR